MVFGNIWLTCKFSSPAKCVRGGPSLCRCACDCSAFTVKIMVVSSRITPATHIWRWQCRLPLPQPAQYRWQFDDCIFRIFSVAHALCFLINTILLLVHSCTHWLSLCLVFYCLFFPLLNQKRRRSCLLSSIHLICDRWFSFNDFDHRNSIGKTITTAIKRRRQRRWWQQPKRRKSKKETISTAIAKNYCTTLPVTHRHAHWSKKKFAHKFHRLCER